MIIFHLLIKF